MRWFVLALLLTPLASAEPVLLFSDERADGTGPGGVPYEGRGVDILAFYARARGVSDQELGIEVAAGNSADEQRYLVTWARHNEETGEFTHGGVRIHFVEKEPIYELLVEGKDRPTWDSSVLAEISGSKDPSGLAWLYFRLYPVAGGPFWGDTLFDWQITSQWQWPTGWGDADHAEGEAPWVLTYGELPPVLAWKQPAGPAQFTGDSSRVEGQGNLTLEGYWREEEGDQVRVTVKVAGVTQDCWQWRFDHRHDLAFGVVGAKMADRARVTSTGAAARAHLDGDAMVIQWLGTPDAANFPKQERLDLDLACGDQVLALSREPVPEQPSAGDLLRERTDRVTPFPSLVAVVTLLALAARRR